MFKRKKSSHCGSGQCVEVEDDETVRVWETGRAEWLTFEPDAWRAFVALVKAGGADD